MSTGSIEAPEFFRKYPIDSAPAKYMPVALPCSFLVNVACDMCQQWIAQGEPSQENFNWIPADNCSYNPGYNLNDFSLSPLLWSTFSHENKSYTEPFGFVAVNIYPP